MEQATLKPAVQQRQSNFELLRIFAMAASVIYHFGFHGGLNYENTPVTVPHLWYLYNFMMGPIGMNTFFMASGYFLITSKSTGISLKKVLKTWGQVFFYSVTIYVVHALITDSFSWEQFFYYAMPIKNKLWWFATTYLILYLLHPYINQYLRSLEKKRYQQFLLTLIILWSVLPSIMNADFESTRLLRFFTLYSVAGYLRLFGTRHTSAAYYGKRAAAMIALTYCMGVAVAFLSQKWPSLAKYEIYFFGTKMITTWVNSILVFMCFANLKIGYNKWINRISSATFAVYLIHDNVIIRPLLWQTLFSGLPIQGSRRIIPYSIMVSFIVYCGCTVIDWLRQATVEKVYMRFVNWVDAKLSGKLAQFGCSLQTKIFGK